MKAQKSNNKQLTLKNFKNTFEFLLDNNVELASDGITPISVNIEAAAGIGKTSVIEQVANERGMTYVKLSLSQLEETGDLIGYPIKEYLMSKQAEDNELDTEWVPEDMLDIYRKDGWIPSSRSRMSYAVPAWIPDENPNGCIVNLDDFSRAPQSLMQAIMEIIYKQEYVSWKLPKNTTVVLTSNPDDGSFNVTGLDEAQKTRCINFELKFNVDEWAEWAEGNGIKNEMINFALSYPKIFEKQNNVNIANARSYVMFCNAVRKINDYSSTNSLYLLHSIASGCFPLDKDNLIASSFTTFVRNNMHTIISPRDILTKPIDEVKAALDKCLKLTDDSGEMNTPVASLLCVRLTNYADFILSDKNVQPTDRLGGNLVTDRLIEVVESGLFPEDTVLYMIQTLYRKHAMKMINVARNPNIMRKLTL